MVRRLSRYAKARMDAVATPELDWAAVTSPRGTPPSRTRVVLAWAGGGAAVLALSGAVAAATGAINVTYMLGNQSVSPNQTVTLSQAVANAAQSRLHFIEPGGLPAGSQLEQVQESTPGSSPFAVNLNYTLPNGDSFSVSEAPAPSKGTYVSFGAAVGAKQPTSGAAHLSMGGLSRGIGGTMVTVAGPLTEAQEAAILQAML
jgi:hypothetical protein